MCCRILCWSKADYDDYVHFNLQVKCLKYSLEDKFQIWGMLSNEMSIFHIIDYAQKKGFIGRTYQISLIVFSNYQHWYRTQKSCMGLGVQVPGCDAYIYCSWF